MKKILLIIGIAFFAFGAILKAQSDDKRLIPTLGSKLGFNYSNVWDERGEDFIADSKIGFVGGFFVGIPFSKTFGVQPELLISQKGFKGSGKLLGSTYSIKRTSTYIDIPVFMQVKPVEFITFFIGPQFSYLVRTKSVYSYGSNSVEQEQEFDNENIRNNILGFGFGADVNISHLVVSARLCWDFQNNNANSTSDTPRYKNQWFQFTLGYKL